MEKRNLCTGLRESFLRKLVLVVSILLLSVPETFAQADADTVYTFRFWRGSTKLFVPAFGNDAELARLEECVSNHIEDILAGRMPLHVDGYCNSKRTEEDNLAVAKGRSNRVKSELITRRGLREEHFITRNHATDGDYVVVRLFAVKAETPERQPATDMTAAETGNPIETSNPSNTSDPSDTSSPSDTSDTRTNSEPITPTTPLFLRANLLRWATLTPDLGIEWRINDNWAVLVNGSWTTWSWNDKARRYALREIMPEVRYYMRGELGGAYLGLSYKVGSFNYKFSQTGKQGDIMGGGITGGYVLKLNNAFSLDFSLGLGYIHAGYDEYILMDGVRVRSGEGSKNWWGPTNIGVSLVWNVFNK